MTQLALALPHRPSHRGEDFFVAPPNEAAVRHVDAWPKWPHHALILVGPEGAGKSHLASVFEARSGAMRVAHGDVGARSRLIRRDVPAVIVEDIDRGLVQGRLDPVDLFHLFNWIGERGGNLLMTSRLAPARLRPALRDLASRLLATPLGEIGPPDDTLLAAVMVKRFRDRQLRVDPALIDYALGRMERSFAALEAFVATLDRESLARRRVPNIALAREAMTLLGWL